jgi:hypothetical protein
MSLGGFSGSDPYPTLTAAFKALVQAGEVHYFIGGTGVGGTRGGGDAGGSSMSPISSWVSKTYDPQTVDEVTVYDLTAGTASATD